MQYTIIKFFIFFSTLLPSGQNFCRNFDFGVRGHHHHEPQASDILNTVLVSIRLASLG